MRKKKRITRTHFNAVPEKGEKNNGPLLTIQNEAYSIKDLIKRHAQGLNINVIQNNQYDGEDITHEDPMISGINNLDPVDAQEILSQSKELDRKTVQEAQDKKDRAAEALKIAEEAKEPDIVEKKEDTSSVKENKVD